ncbi:MAG: histidine phosphotransferase family protein [Pseudomonadota bacterium]
MDDQPMMADDITALVGSRLCHDLINPLGAIGNGVELLAMMPGSTGPEVSLIEEAVRDAQARIRFFRIAFGQTGTDNLIARREIIEIVDGLYGHSGRLKVVWEPEAELPRGDAKIGLLMLACAEHALQLGGVITINEANSVFRLHAEGKRVAMDADLWSILKGVTPMRPLAPAEVQFALFAQEALKQDRVVRVDATETTLTVEA